MAANLPSTQPYLIRAIHEWCSDNGFTPHVVVRVDGRARVPREHVKDGQIVLNIAYEATGGLQIGNDLVSFQARFGGVARDISFPVGNVAKIYARENGVGMAFEPEPGMPPPDGRPRLRRVK
jgi:stringent starvation protein B